ncbi:hypothetical protein HPB48_011184 [Haemaphysalis longicornis]|uniref:Uncharacterized protein n=1 Tax=Haemaphysalis longicornis TaxID=44386 RepID=A0A9J6FXF3_HAELO|nr:hypothetical protein HPB48_011184 [Haemaphysalis longicornis]
MFCSIQRATGANGMSSRRRVAPLHPLHSGQAADNGLPVDLFYHRLALNFRKRGPLAAVRAQHSNRDPDIDWRSSMEALPLKRQPDGSPDSSTARRT